MLRSQFGALVLRDQQGATVYHEGRLRVDAKVQYKDTLRINNPSWEQKTYRITVLAHGQTIIVQGDGPIRSPASTAWRRCRHGYRETLQLLWRQNDLLLKIFNHGNNYWWLGSHQWSVYFQYQAHLLRIINYWPIDWWWWWWFYSLLVVVLVVLVVGFITESFFEAITVWITDRKLWSLAGEGWAGWAEPADPDVLVWLVKPGRRGGDKLR